MKFVSIPEPEQEGSNKISLTLGYYSGLSSKKSPQSGDEFLALYFDRFLQRRANLLGSFYMAYTVPLSER